MTARAWDEALDAFSGHILAEKGLARATQEAMRHDLAHLRAWAEKEGGLSPAEITDQHLRDFLLAVSGRLQASSRARLLSTLRSFFRFLVGEQAASEDPTVTLVAPRRGAQAARCS